MGRGGTVLQQTHLEPAQACVVDISPPPDYPSRLSLSRTHADERDRRRRLLISVGNRSGPW